MSIKCRAHHTGHTVIGCVQLLTSLLAVSLLKMQLLHRTVGTSVAIFFLPSVARTKHLYSADCRCTPNLIIDKLLSLAMIIDKLLTLATAYRVYIPRFAWFHVSCNVQSLSESRQGVTSTHLGSSPRSTAVPHRAEGVTSCTEVVQTLTPLHGDGKRP